jgi:hypothetical protein
MKRTVRVSAVAIALVLGAIATAQADTTIQTDRVRVTVSDGGNVQVRTSDLSNLPQGLTPPELTYPSANIVRLLGCHQQRQRLQDYAVSGNGDRVISQSQSRVIVCQ